MRLARAALVICVLFAAPAPLSPLPVRSIAQEADFTFRRVRPPRPGAKKRIVFNNSSSSALPGRAQSYAWFWKDVAAGIAAADPARLDRIVTANAARFTGAWPGLGGPEAARRVAREHGAALTKAVANANVSLALLLAVIGVESGGDPRARSPAGARGLMQLMPGTARRFGVSDAYDPAQSIAGGAAYLDVLLRMFNDDALLALAAYNAGENAVLKYKGVPPYAETRDYVAKVLASFHGVRALCATPPRGPREACDLRPGA